MNCQHLGPWGPAKGIEMSESLASVVFSSGPLCNATATVDRVGEHLLVRFEGELDECFNPVGASLIQMLSEQARAVHVDFSRLTLFGAAGVGWLVDLYAATPAEVRVVRTNALVREVLDLCDVPTRHSGQEPRGGRSQDSGRFADAL